MSSAFALSIALCKSENIGLTVYLIHAELYSLGDNVRKLGEILVISVAKIGIITDSKQLAVAYLRCEIVAESLFQRFIAGRKS